MQPTVSAFLAGCILSQWQGQCVRGPQDLFVARLISIRFLHGACNTQWRRGADCCTSADCAYATFETLRFNDSERSSVGVFQIISFNIYCLLCLLLLKIGKVKDSAPFFVLKI